MPDPFQVEERKNAWLRAKRAREAFWLSAAESQRPGDAEFYDGEEERTWRKYRAVAPEAVRDWTDYRPAAPVKTDEQSAPPAPAELGTFGYFVISAGFLFCWLGGAILLWGLHPILGLAWFFLCPSWLRRLFC